MIKIDGREISKKIRFGLKNKIDILSNDHSVIPGLAVILVGDDPASKVYVGMKEKAFHKLGLVSETFRLSADVKLDEILQLINNLNNDNKFHGILVQLPLPDHLDSLEVIKAIDPKKDADGLHPENLGNMILDIEAPLPCTPHGILMLLKYYNIETNGKHVVVIGRSNIVGKPIANLLSKKAKFGNATVTVCHSRTKKLQYFVKQADIVIASIGKAELIDASFIKKGAVVIDVGVNRVEDLSLEKGYKLVGDVNYAEVSKIASAITPVPGGVGPMTISMLIYNTVYLAEQSII